MKKNVKSFPKAVGDAPLMVSTVLLNRYNTTYRAIYQVGPEKQAVVDIDEQVWMKLSQEQIQRAAESKVRAAR